MIRGHGREGQPDGGLLEQKQHSNERRGSWGLGMPLESHILPLGPQFLHTEYERDLLDTL